MHSRSYRGIYDRQTRLARLNSVLTAVAIVLALAVGVTASLRYEIGSLALGTITFASP